MRYESYSAAENQALDLWVKLARSFNVFNRGALEHIRSCELTQSQFAVVECLGHKGEMTLGELSGKMLMSCGNITVVVDNLEKDGLVTRSRSSQDRRVIHVRLTSEGESLFQRIFPEHAKRVAELAAVLSSEEQQQLALLLRKLGLGLQQREG